MFPASLPESEFDADLSRLSQAVPPAFCLRVLDGCLAFGIWVCDRDGGVVHVSQPFLDLMGMGLAECRASGWVARLPADEAQIVADKWRLCLKDGNAWEHQFRVRATGGRLKHILSRGVPVHDAEGATSAWVGMHFDVSEMKETEEELRQSQERFRVALESGCDLLYECESATGMRRWFGPVDEILGYGREDFPRTESAWEQGLHPEDREAVLRARARHLEGRGPFHVEYRIRRKDGEFVHWLDRGKAMRDKDGSPRFWIGFVTDMTERRRSEDMLRRSEERRRISQRLEVIGRLAGGIAHDFNNSSPPSTATANWCWANSGRTARSRRK